MAATEVTIERLRELLVYFPATGSLCWRVDRMGGFKRSVVVGAAGTTAGCARKDGRRVVRVDGKLLMSYRVAWALYYGRWPEGQIDHINGDKTDDRLENLRDVTHLVNQQNRRASYRGKKSSSLIGVFANKRNRTSPWRACITVDGKHQQIGVYATEADAHEAYVLAKRKLHEGCTL